MEAVRTERLTKYYGKRIRAVNNLDLVVEEGHAVGLLGPNGAGKTTTMKILTGLLKPTSGKAFIYGVDVTKDPVRALKNVGAMIESPELYPELTARENLAYLGRLKGLSGERLKRRIREVLEMVRMEEWADVPVGKFSRGMKQRIAIAQSFIHEPDLLILDEPSLGLDPLGMVEVREIIKDLNKDGVTVLLASHLLNEVQQICNRVVLINKGEVILKGDLSELEKAGGTKIYEASILGGVKERDLDFLKDIDVVKNFEVLNSQLVKIYISEEREVPRVIRTMLEKGVNIIEFRRSRSMLEEVYMNLVSEVS